MLRFRTPLPNLASFSLGALGGLIIFTLLFFPGAYQSKQTHVDTYGNALAITAAKRSIDAAFGNDLVGLRVILQDTVDNPNVRLATVHDVEHNLLVQAGELPYYALESDQMFTSEIVLQDSIAGYLTVVISPPATASSLNKILILIWFILFAATASWSLWQSQAVSFYIPSFWKQLQKFSENLSASANPKDKNKPSSAPKQNAYISNIESNDHNHPLDTDLTTTLDQQQNYDIYVGLQITKLTELRQQLSGEAFRTLVDNIETRIAEAMGLYSGAQYLWKNERYLLHLSSNEEHSADLIFKACCASQLIFDLCSHIKAPLELKALVSPDKNSALNQKLSHDGIALFLDPDHTDNPSADNDNDRPEHVLSNRIELIHAMETPKLQIVRAFRAPYQQLLSNQYQQLQDTLS